MIETRVRVVRTQGDTAWVEPTEASGCAACQAQSACGVSGVTSGLGRFFASRRQPVALCVADVRPGQELTLALGESELLRAGLLAYLLPVILALAGAGTAALQGLGDLGTVLGMALGFAIGLAVAARLSRRLARPQPLLADTPLSSPNQGETP